MLRERLRECDGRADCAKTGPLMVLLHRFFASVGGTGGSRGCSFGCVGEWLRMSGREKGSEGGSTG